MQTKGTKQICENRQARHEYFILERYEAGISLQGNEVKSIRQGHVNLKDAWCDISDGELFIKGMHITPYEKDGLFRTDPMRVRKLLMHRQEINRMFGKVKQELIGLLTREDRDEELGEFCIDMLMIAKYFERIGDHATNIAEWVEYSITGTHLE